MEANTKGGNMVKKRFILIILFTLISLIRSQLWIAPAPLMPRLMQELGLSYAQSGQLIFIVPVIMGMFLFIGSVITDRIGHGLSMTLGLLALSADGLISGIAADFGTLFLGHLLCGAGFGLTVGAMPAFVSERFTPRGQAYANSFNTAMTPLGMALCYAIVIPLADLFSSWKTVYLLWAASAFLCAVLFYLYDRKKIHAFFAEQKNSKMIKSAQIPCIMAAARFKDIWLMALIMCGSLWAYNGFSTYLPSFLSAEKGMDLGTSSAAASVMQFAGIAGCLIWSAVYAKKSNRRFLISLPLAAMLAGCLGITLLPTGVWLYICVFITGASYYAFASVVLTLVMQVKGMLPQYIPGSVAIYLGIASLTSIAAPFIFGAIEQSAGIQTAFLLFSLLIIPSIAGGLMIKRQVST
jgi:cyanate permease